MHSVGSRVTSLVPAGARGLDIVLLEFEMGSGLWKLLPTLVFLKQFLECGIIAEHIVNLLDGPLLPLTQIKRGFLGLFIFLVLHLLHLVGRGDLGRSAHASACDETDPINTCGWMLWWDGRRGQLRGLTIRVISTARASLLAGGWAHLASVTSLLPCDWPASVFPLLIVVTLLHALLICQPCTIAQDITPLFCAILGVGVACSWLHPILIGKGVRMSLWCWIKRTLVKAFIFPTPLDRRWHSPRCCINGIVDLVGIAAGIAGSLKIEGCHSLWQTNTLCRTSST